MNNCTNFKYWTAGGDYVNNCTGGWPPHNISVSERGPNTRLRNIEPLDRLPAIIKELGQPDQINRVNGGFAFWSKKTLESKGLPWESVTVQFAAPTGNKLVGVSVDHEAQKPYNHNLVLSAGNNMPTFANRNVSRVPAPDGFDYYHEIGFRNHPDIQPADKFEQNVWDPQL